MNNVPLLRHSGYRNNKEINRERMKSTAPINTARKATETNTTIVDSVNSSRVGHVTFFISVCTSFKNSLVCLIISFPASPARIYYLFHFFHSNQLQAHTT